MPVTIRGETYYRTSEACSRAGVSRATLFRWLKQGVLSQSRKDRRGWRLFTESDLAAIRAEGERIEMNPISE